MHVLKARNVNHAYLQGLELLHTKEYSYTTETRNGPARVANETVCTRYANPTERVLFNAQRDANPFFHLLEALWMLTGANDVALPAYFVPRMREFSDDGATFHAAYGHRWRRHFGPHAEDAYAPPVDQLSLIIKELRECPGSRRVVLQMWDPAVDLGRTQGRDLPCNVAAKFEVDGRNGALNMIVFNRSNDIVLGAYGANVVQFSVLQEFLASAIGVPTGYYEQISTNYHAYHTQLCKVWPLAWTGGTEPTYDRIPADRSVRILPLVTDASTFLAECEDMLALARKNDYVVPLTRVERYRNTFLRDVVSPMLWAYAHYRMDDIKPALREIERGLRDNDRVDWLVAAHNWLLRRVK